MGEYIEIINLSKSFDNHIVFDKLSIKFRRGRIYCVMGPSGIGKTTLLKVLMGLEQADSGKIIGMDNLRTGAVFQEDRLIEHLNAVENLSFVLNKNKSKEELITALALLGIEKEHMNKPVRDLSGGMRRRVCLLRAILFASDIIIMDEPFNGLDDESKQEAIDYFLKNLNGRTAIIVTHDEKEVIALQAEKFII